MAYNLEKVKTMENGINIYRQVSSIGGYNYYSDSRGELLIKICSALSIEELEEVIKLKKEELSC